MAREFSVDVKLKGFTRRPTFVADRVEQADQTVFYHGSDIVATIIPGQELILYFGDGTVRSRHPWENVEDLLIGEQAQGVKRIEVNEPEQPQGFSVNHRQRIALAVGLAVFLVTGLFPPWRCVLFPKHQNAIAKFWGYHFILTPPVPKDLSRLQELFPIYRSSPDYLVQHTQFDLDFATLLVQWIVVIATVTGIVFLLGHQPTDSSQLPSKVRPLLGKQIRKFFAICFLLSGTVHVIGRLVEGPVPPGNRPSTGDPVGDLVADVMGVTFIACLLAYLLWPKGAARKPDAETGQVR